MNKATWKMSSKWLVSFTRQCSTTSCSDCEKVPYQTQCYHSEILCIFYQSSTYGFLPVSTTENEVEGTLF